MRFTPTNLKNSYLIDLDFKRDERGFFARFFCTDEFAKHGLPNNFIQGNTSLSVQKGTLRGMHYQLAPKGEDKLVRCLHGSILDMILDLRPESATFGRSFGAVLSAENRRMMYVPQGFAHGFLTLEDHTEVFYLVTETYSKELERGIRWNDPYFNMEWPEEPLVISERDNNHPNFSHDYHLAHNGGFQ